MLRVVRGGVHRYVHLRLKYNSRVEVGTEYWPEGPSHMT
jgi:hypothetical protein